MDNISLKPTIKLDVLYRWFETYWMPQFADTELITLMANEGCLNENVLQRLVNQYQLPNDFTFAGYQFRDCEDVIRVGRLNDDGLINQYSGAYQYTFVANGVEVQALLLSTFHNDDYPSVISLVCIPRAFTQIWHAFSKECERLHFGLEPDDKVVIIGGKTASFVPTVKWDDVILPEKLKADIKHDMQSFFTKGIHVYKRLNLKPFRKLLLAGVPGTGKTMLCSALAKWALEQNYVVIYVSSADQEGATFGKIQDALRVASKAKHPALIIVEELDAYLSKEEEKALVLNVLDGSESTIADMGAMLLATTNYPEAIDERVLKRPGRLDRMFIIPETQDNIAAEKLLRQYLGDMWQESHMALVPQLVGYPGAFVREVAVYALTQVAFDDLPELSLALLLQSFEGLKAQIDMKDNFLAQQHQSRSLMSRLSNGRMQGTP
jgi:adenylate kinase